MQDDVLLALNYIQDPEIGIGIVDLGLVYRADWTENGIEVELTLTSPSCPFSHELVDQTREVLQRRFREAKAIRVGLVWDPPWTLDRINDNARRQLGWSKQPSADSGRGRARGFWKH